MSVEEAKAFMEKAKTDKDLQEKLKEVDSEEKFFAVAKAAGFDFTEEELKTVLPRQSKGELSAEDLEGVAGGLGQTMNPARGNKSSWLCWL